MRLRPSRCAGSAARRSDKTRALPVENARPDARPVCAFSFETEVRDLRPLRRETGTGRAIRGRPSAVPQMQAWYMELIRQVNRRATARTLESGLEERLGVALCERCRREWRR